MTSQAFCYWAQGFFELADPHSLSAEQIKIIRAHLNMVFVHEIDPQAGDQTVQDKLNEIHGNKPDIGNGIGYSPIGGDGTTYRC